MPLGELLALLAGGEHEGVGSMFGVEESLGRDVVARGCRRRTSTEAAHGILRHKALRRGKRFGGFLHDPMLTLFPRVGNKKAAQMIIRDEELEYEHNLARYSNLDLLTGDPERDAPWICEAKKNHAQTVSYAIRGVYTDAAVLGQRVDSAESKLQLKFGVARRTKFIWLSLQHLLGLIPPNRNEPLPNVDVDEVERDLNVIYVNIRGTLDNFARCLVDLIGDENTQKLPPISIDLFGKEFLKDVKLGEVAAFIRGFSEWNNELKGLRDPAVHRIPLSVPPAVLDEAAQQEHERLWTEYNEIINEAVTAIRNGADSSAMFKKAEPVRPLG